MKVPERMHFIIKSIRKRIRNQSLLSNPFSSPLMLNKMALKRPRIIKLSSADALLIGGASARILLC